ncbi:MAG: hypothetical protein KDA86_24070 [Planctomycetaceae bacterium]|nr:hypothetical protein [Planctomycetaceae bacterium]MCA9108811.1 hypothetical protein [Planctomycetaceae bacterium]
MSSHKYRKLLTNLPSMAAVVNSFQSPEVQLEVYRLLVSELEEATSESSPTPSLAMSGVTNSLSGGQSEGELAHQLVDGESIHSISAEDEDD